MKINNKRQGFLVIGILACIVIGLILVWAEVRSHEQIQERQDTQKASGAEKKHSTKKDKKSTGKEHPVEIKHELGTVGKKDDPKFADIKAMIDSYGYQGSVLLIRNGKPIWQQGFGEMSPGVPFEPDTPICLTSITKNVTAYLLMKELAKQHISLDSPVSTFYPDLPGAQENTLRDLIRMDAPYKGQGYAKEEMSEKEYMAFYLNNLTYVPDSSGKWHYNAADYQLLTNILYKLTGMTYNELVEKEIKPNYKILTVDEFANLPNRPVSVNKTGAKVTFDQQKFDREIGTGNLFMSAWEAYRFVSDEIQGKNLTPSEFADLTKSRESSVYGYSGGMYKTKFGYRLHGILGGFEPTIELDKTGRNGVVLFSNYATTKIDKQLAQPIFDKWVNMK